jgi:hypothetical protein
MELQDLKEILACLTGERTKFYYFRDRYALMLLKDYIGAKTISINQLKQSPYASLLNKSPVKKVLAAAGNGLISAKMLEMSWDEKPLAFVMTLDQWGDGKKYWKWNQMSRQGYHLVLQLNMATDHTQQFQKLIRPDDVHTFNSWSHPSLKDGNRGTLAWVRLDLDFETNEVLIEEIQCDWVKEVREAVKEGYDWYGEYSSDEIQSYANDVLAPYAKIWEEAMLSATIDFIRHELGINSIYYHSFEIGALLKHIKYSKPPRSLYTKLPKQFGFQKTPQGPEFLMREKRVLKLQKQVNEPYWFTLPQVAYN